MYSFTNETDLGMYRSTLNTLSFCSNSFDALDISKTQISANVPLLVPTGTSTSPSIIFSSSDVQTGIYRNGATSIQLVMVQKCLE